MRQGREALLAQWQFCRGRSMAKATARRPGLYKLFTHVDLEFLFGLTAKRRRLILARQSCVVGFSGISMNEKSPRVLKASSSRFAAMQMDLGNLMSMLVPPLPILWFGISMLIYALHRHHPDPRVGKYTQWAAYRFYGVMGLIIPVGTFFPGKGITPWLIAWGIGVLIIVPWSIWSMIRVRREDWQDIELPEPEQQEEFEHV